MNALPFPVRIAAGLVATAVEQARDLPRLVIEFPVTAVSQALQASMRVQQRVTELAIKGDRVLGTLRPVEEKPSWATFDEDESASHNGASTVTELRPLARPPSFTADEIAEELADEIGTEIDEEIDEEIARQLDEEAAGEFDEELGAELDDELDAEADEQAAEEAAEEFAEELGEDLALAIDEDAAALTGPDLAEPDLAAAELTAADLTEPDVTAADLVEADLVEPDLTGPDLAGPELGGLGVGVPGVAPVVDGPEPAALPSYPHLTIPQLRGRLRFLSVEDLRALLAWEMAHDDRPPYVTMLTNRITTVLEG